MKRRLLRVAIFGCALYLGLCGAARLCYRQVMYPSPGGRVEAPPGARLVEMTASDGQRVHALYFPGDPVVVQFHGNGETIAGGVGAAEELVARGLGVLLVEYRGYGISEGMPTEQGLYADATGALDWLAARGLGPEHVVLWGWSLGSGVAAEMAVRGRGRALVLISPSTSAPDVGAQMAPFLPMRLLMADKFDTLAKAPRIGVPALVIHGDKDAMIPFAMGQAVARALPEARFLAVPGGGHGDVLEVGGEEVLGGVCELARGTPGGGR